MPQAERITITLYTEQLALVDKVAAAHFDGNRSLAIRRIIDSYQDTISNEAMSALAGQGVVVPSSP